MKALVIIFATVLVTFYFFWQGANAQGDFIIEKCSSGEAFSYRGSSFICTKSKGECGNE